jgi:hypothetical protein
MTAGAVSQLGSLSTGQYDKTPLGFAADRIVSCLNEGIKVTIDSKTFSKTDTKNDIKEALIKAKTPDAELQRLVNLRTPDQRKDIGSIDISDKGVTTQTKAAIKHKSASKPGTDGKKADTKKDTQAPTPEPVVEPTTDFKTTFKVSDEAMSRGYITRADIQAGAMSDYYFNLFDKNSLDDGTADGKISIDEIKTGMANLYAFMASSGLDKDAALKVFNAATKFKTISISTIKDTASEIEFSLGVSHNTTYKQLSSELEKKNGAAFDEPLKYIFSKVTGIAYDKVGKDTKIGGKNAEEQKARVRKLCGFLATLAFISKLTEADQKEIMAGVKTTVKVFTEKDYSAENVFKYLGVYRKKKANMDEDVAASTASANPAQEAPAENGKADKKDTTKKLDPAANNDQQVKTDPAEIAIKSAKKAIMAGKTDQKTFNDNRRDLETLLKNHSTDAGFKDKIYNVIKDLTPPSDEHKKAIYKMLGR